MTSVSSRSHDTFFQFWILITTNCKHTYVNVTSHSVSLHRRDTHQLLYGDRMSWKSFRYLSTLHIWVSDHIYASLRISTHSFFSIDSACHPVFRSLPLEALLQNHQQQLWTLSVLIYHQKPKHLLNQTHSQNKIQLKTQHLPPYHHHHHKPTPSQP